jgi:multiple sugar transport system permease protein
MSPHPHGSAPLAWFSKLGRDRYIRYLLLLPAVLLLLVFTIYPYIYALHISFYAYQYGRPTKLIGLTNYQRMLGDSAFWQSMLRTVAFTVTVVLVELVIGLVLALLANREIRFRGFFRTSLFLPMVIAPVVVAIVWRLLYNQEFGLLNFLTDNVLHLGRPSWLGDPKLAFLSIALMDVWQWTPFMFLVLLAGLQSIPVELYEAAYVDGGTALQVLRYVTLPLLNATVLVALLVRTVDALRIFDQVFLLTQGGPGSTTEFVSLFIYKTAFKFSQMGYASTLLLVLFVITIALALIYIRLLGKGAEVER